MAKLLHDESNELNRDTLSRRLVRGGYSAVLAVDGERGVATALSAEEILDEVRFGLSPSPRYPGAPRVGR